MNICSSQGWHSRPSNSLFCRNLLRTIALLLLRGVWLVDEADAESKEEEEEETNDDEGIAHISLSDAIIDTTASANLAVLSRSTIASSRSKKPATQPWARARVKTSRLNRSETSPRRGSDNVVEAASAPAAAVVAAEAEAAAARRSNRRSTAGEC